jgi:hypothetical protein
MVSPPLQHPPATEARAFDASAPANRRAEARVSGARLTLAILAWILVSLVIAALTLVVARVVAPAHI